MFLSAPALPEAIENNSFANRNLSKKNYLRVNHHFLGNIFFLLLGKTTFYRISYISITTYTMALGHKEKNKDIRPANNNNISRGQRTFFLTYILLLTCIMYIIFLMTKSSTYLLL